MTVSFFIEQEGANGVIEITQHVFLIKDESMKANVFVLADKKGYSLIDTGIFMKTKYLIKILEENKLPVSDLKLIILTHCHCDHIGGTAELVRVSGAKVAANKNDIPYILQRDIIAGPYHKMMAEEQKCMRRFNCVVEQIDVELDDGDTVDIIGGLQVINVPGHTPGSIALFQAEKKMMFFGDVIRNNEKNGLVIGIPEEFNINTEQVHRDAEKLISYPIEYALFSHGSPVIKNASSILNGLL
jgi:glyoxylase-like metal-dependent hydrolase (beta-lactamase superfamily II)